MQCRFVVALCALVPMVAPAWRLPGQSTPIVLRGGTIVPVAGAPIQAGIIVLQGGKIAAIGANVGTVGPTRILAVAVLPEPMTAAPTASEVST